jgi:membrane fusion protein, multidrug efflux system
LRYSLSFAVSVSLLALGAVALSGCGQHQQMTMPQTEVGVVTLKAEPVTLSSALSGRTNATVTADVRPQVSGVIEQRLFQEGALVHAGQPLYQIDARLYQASLDTAKAQLESAQATLFSAEAKDRRYKTLGNSPAVSAQDKDDTAAAAMTARASIHQYQASIKTAAVNLEYTRVLAPITGRIGRSSVTRGALVSSDQTTALATITQLDPIYVDITQSSTDLLKLRTALAHGQVLPASADVTLTLEDGTRYPLQGKVEFSEVTVDTQAGTVTIRARFPNPDGLLLPGMFVHVDTPQGTLRDAVLVPQQAIARDAKGNGTAYVVDAAGKVESRTVTTGQAIGTKWLVTAGLKAGDRVVVEGNDKVQPGQTVKAVAAGLGN